MFRCGLSGGEASGEESRWRVMGAGLGSILKLQTFVSLGSLKLCRLFFLLINLLRLLNLISSPDSSMFPSWSDATLNKRIKREASPSQLQTKYPLWRERPFPRTNILLGKLKHSINRPRSRVSYFTTLHSLNIHMTTPYFGPRSWKLFSLRRSL